MWLAFTARVDAILGAMSRRRLLPPYLQHLHPSVREFVPIDPATRSRALAERGHVTSWRARQIHRVIADVT
jgi:hypothetical protein